MLDIYFQKDVCMHDDVLIKYVDVSALAVHGCFMLLTFSFFIKVTDPLFKYYSTAM